MNTINNSVSFGAKLDCGCVKGSNKARWEKIAAVFQEKTKKYPDDVFVVHTNNEGSLYFYPKYSNPKLEDAAESYDKGRIDLDSTKALEICSAEKAADIFKRLFNIRRKSDTMLMDYFNFENKYDLTNEKKGNMADKLYMEFINLRKAYAEHGVNTDKVLKTWTGIEVV